MKYASSVAICNIEEARFKLDELLSQFGDTVEQSAKRASKTVARRENAQSTPVADVKAAAKAVEASKQTFEAEIARQAEALKEETEQMILAEVRVVLIDTIGPKRKIEKSS